jgi:uracil-DNA glycosylase family 4
VMFIGEAPGRLGADSSEIPFHGDQAGHNFEELLTFAGLSRAEIFITNSVLCNPKAETGNNATPNRVEIESCSDYLKEQIDIVEPKIIVTLGTIALEALRRVVPHDVSLSRDVRTAIQWYGRLLIPLYHPGARAMIHRSMANQRSDYQFVGEIARRGIRARPRASSSGITRSSVAEVARRILSSRAVSYFALHKLTYLVECEGWKTRGVGVTGAYFIRQKDGPYCTDLHIAKLKKALDGLVVKEIGGKLVLSLGQQKLLDANGHNQAEDEAVIDHVVNSTVGLSDSELKAKVYMTTPMRDILRRERTQLLNLYNSPIRFGAKRIEKLEALNPPA